jgi:Nuclease-related domain
VRDWLYPYYCGAGRGARVKYDEVSGRWRKRVFRRVRWVFVGLAVPLIVGTGLAQHRLWIWLFGLALGALMAAYIALRESPPGYIENWRTGFEGERRTARAPLRRDGYVLLHDLPDRRTGGQGRNGNIDHVVVSTGGVFLLDSKWLGGEVSIAGDVIHVQRRDDDDASYDLLWLACGMRGRAVRLQEDIAEQADVRFVQPVVIFWNEFEAGHVMGETLSSPRDRLVDWLREQKPRMTPERVAHAAACIKDARPSEHPAWWDRLPTLGFRGQGGLVATGTAEGAAREG